MVEDALSLRKHTGERPAAAATDPDSTASFYLRFDIVNMFPDLRVSVLSEPAAGTCPGRATLLRWEIMADGVILELLDRVAGSDDFSGIVFTQLPHQQRLAVGRGLAPELLQLDVLRQYTVSQQDKAAQVKHVYPAALESHPAAALDATDIDISM
ncbi:hypothetical protein HRG_004143 [Hirsutella rhossiliensis]|uniref:Uncharacterized protein n=1 Tax=Hirsutella rhossiliensis TaxID=111463 RepID=A0A9P8N3X3_9HYPO|nr:uncharacterized protein HRG_04143 [Hirsutella rhossiliensis]KAH0966127.1 hypothetical protein HRG_04143 [Hirsutella rhossiliensis]